MTTFNHIARAGTSAALALFALARPLAAQSLGERIARVSEGVIRVSFNVHRGVCGRGNSIRHSDNTVQWGDDRNEDIEFDEICYPGPGRLVVQRRSGKTVSLRFYVGGRWRASSTAIDLGMAAAPDVASYLVSLVQSGTGDIAEKAVFPATLADSANVWPAFIRLARDNTRPRKAREQVVFWLGQAAGDSATAHLNSIALDNGIEREIRKQAVFALSQRPREEGIPALISIARTNRDPELRKNALFWLGQSHDPRALDLFEELILKK